MSILSQYSLGLALLASLAAQPNPGSIVSSGILPSGGATAVLDRAGNIYAASSSISAAGVTPGAAQTQSGGGTCMPLFHGGALPCSDAFIIKMDSSGNKVFATLLGGPTADSATAVATDAAGNIYVAGTTGGSFPTTPNAAIPQSAGGTFAAKLSPDGAKFLYVTYLPALINAIAIAVDAHGNAYIAGQQGTHLAVVALSADGSSILYTKLLAGSKQDQVKAIAADASGDVFVLGATNSPDFPMTEGAFQTALSGTQNAFLTKLDPAGNIVFSTYFGGSGTDTPLAVTLDSEGGIYLAGQTSSLDLPTTPQSFQPQPLIPAFSSTPGGFIAKLSADGGSIVYATYIPTNTTPASVPFGTSTIAVLAAGSSGDVYFAGPARVGFPVTDSGPMQCVGGGSDELGSDVMAHLDAQGALIEATYLNEVNANALAIAPDGTVLVAGEFLSKIRFGDPGWVTPACVTQSALNSATLNVSGVAPGTFMSLSGFGIGPDDGAIALPGPDGTPTSLGGVQVFFDELAAPMIYAQSRQVNFQAPFELAGRSTTSITLRYNGQTFGPISARVHFGAPGLFRVRPNISAQAMAMNQDFTANGPSNPAPRGSIISVWGTGLGSIDPMCSTGGLNPPGAANLAAGLSVQVAGLDPPVGNAFGTPVLYAGSAPTLACGVVQVNFQIPADLPPGPRLIKLISVFTAPDGTQSSIVSADPGSLIYIQ